MSTTKTVSTRIDDNVHTLFTNYCNQKGIHLLFGLGAIMQQFGEKSKSDLIDYDLPRNRLQNTLEKRGIVSVDMTGAMLEHHSNDDPVIFSDGHMNEKGHRIFARELKRRIENNNWLN